MSSALYDDDLYTWSLEQPSLLKKRKFDQLDLEHIIEDMSKSVNQESENCSLF